MWSMQEQYAESLADNWTPTPTFGNVSVLTIAGGGGGGGAGGGAGGYQWISSLNLGNKNSYTVVVGAGGDGYNGEYPTCGGTCGTRSSFGGPDIQTMTVEAGGS